MQSELIITVLTDNNPAEGLLCEWGLSFHIGYGGKRYLLDTGSTDAFAANALALGIDLAAVDVAVLSHAHYDHTGGTAAFLAANPKAPVYLSPSARENCWSRHGLKMKYIGLPEGILQSERMVREDGIISLDRGVWIVPHSGCCRDRKKVARKSGLFVRKGWRFVPDDFAHERSLVFRAAKGLVVLNSCSHTGPEAIIQEVEAAVPGEKVYAYIGGLHLFRLNAAEVGKTADRLAESGLEKIYTGHCTGDEAFSVLKEKLGERVELFRPGMIMEF